VIESISKIFNNREISIFIWVVILLFWIFSKKETRKSSISVIKAFLKLFKWYLIMVIYIVILIIIFHKMRLWDFSLLKNTIYWTFGGAFILFFNVNKALENEKYFTKIFKDCFKLIIVVEFLSNLYSFNIVIELISIPILVFTGAMLGFSENKTEHKNVQILFNGVLIIYTLGVLIYSFVRISDSFKSLLTIENLKSLLFGSAMTLLLIPFLYLVALYMAYEDFLKMKKFILKENAKLYRFLKWEVFNRCRFSLKRIKIVNKNLHIYTSIEKEQIKYELNSIFGNNDKFRNTTLPN
jgi:hypothetical protein